MQMKKVNLKQGTLAWEAARETRIGGSEVFDIVRYYSTEEELQNCGIDALKFKTEKPYTSAWALYHKILNDGVYQKKALEPELAEYGHAAEPYGVYVLQKGRERRLKAGEVYASDRLIASLDISGISEAKDIRPFDRGGGMVKPNRRFVCEQKTMRPEMVKNGIPYKYIVQAQYQIITSKADFYILQIMILKEDTVFERGKITQMSKKKRIEYLKENMTVEHFYFNHNEHLAMLIKKCLERFFKDVENRIEPTAFIANDTQKNIIESIRINTLYNKNLSLKYDLSEYVKSKNACDEADKKKKEELQKIIETAKEYNACKFISDDGYTGSFSAAGAFLIKEPKDNGKI